MSRGLLPTPRFPTQGIERERSQTTPPNATKRFEADDYASLEKHSDQPEVRERIRQAIAEGKIRVLPDPVHPERVRIVVLNKS